MTNEELAGVDELVGRLKGRVRQRLPIDWQKNRQCPECGTAADRPKCMWELGGNCPRHDPENYDPSPFIEEPDPDCYAAVTALQSLIATAREAEALREKLTSLEDTATKAVSDLGAKLGRKEAELDAALADLAGATREVEGLRAENARLTLTVRKLQGNQAALEAALKENPNAG